MTAAPNLREIYSNVCLTAKYYSTQNSYLNLCSTTSTI